MKTSENVYGFCFLIFMILGTQLLSAQNKISGTIIDLKERTPIIGANIYLEGTTFGVASDNEGKYIITGIPDGTYTLYACQNGYVTQEYALDIYQNKSVHFRLKQRNVDKNVVVVTGTRTKKQLSQSPIQTRVINKTTISKQGVSNITQALGNNIASFEATKGYMTNSFSFNGFAPNHTLLLIDGERVTRRDESVIDFSRINLSAIEQIEITNGAASTLYGSNAIGGVINIITRDVSRPVEVNAGVLNTMFSDPSNEKGRSEQYAYANLNLQKGKLSSFTNVKANNYAPYDINAGNGIFNILTQEEENNYSINQKLIFRINNKLSFNGNVAYHQFKQNFQSTEFTDVKNNNLTYNLKTNFYPTNKIKIQLSFLGDQNKTYDVINLGTSKSNRLDFENLFQNARFLGNIKLAKFNDITLGAEYFIEKQTSLQNNFQDKEIEHYAVFFQDEISVSKNIAFIAGGRTENHSTFGTSFTPQFSLLVSKDNLSFRGSYGKGFRAPSIKELYSSEFMLPPNGSIYNWSVDGNTELKPETSNFLSASVHYSNEKLDISASYSFNDVSQLITLSDTYHLVMNDSIEPPVIKSFNYTYENINEATVQSINAFANYQLFRWLNLNASYTFTNAKDVTADMVLPNIRKHSGRLNVNFNHIIRKIMVTANLNSSYFGSKNVVNIFSHQREFIKLSDFMLWKLMTTYTIKDHYTLKFGVNNLLDKTDDQAQFLNIISPGRTFVVGASISF